MMRENSPNFTGPLRAPAGFRINGLQICDVADLVAEFFILP
jgi:hypothetical protein